MKFETPYVEVKKFDLKDILTTSGESEDPTICDLNNDLPCVGD